MYLGRDHVWVVWVEARALFEDGRRRDAAHALVAVARLVDHAQHEGMVVVSHLRAAIGSRQRPSGAFKCHKVISRAATMAEAAKAEVAAAEATAAAAAAAIAEAAEAAAEAAEAAAEAGGVTAVAVTSVATVPSQSEATSSHQKQSVTSVATVPSRLPYL